VRRCRWWGCIHDRSISALETGSPFHTYPRRRSALRSAGEEREPKEREPKERGPKERGPKERGPKERGPKERGPKEREPKEREPKEREPKEREPKEREPKKRGSKLLRCGAQTPSFDLRRKRLAHIYLSCPGEGRDWAFCPIASEFTPTSYSASYPFTLGAIQVLAT